jgi:hypothetical protein
VHPLDEGGHRQYVVARLRSVVDSSHRKQERGNGIRLDEGVVGGGDRVGSADRASVLRVLPCGANLATVRRVGIDTEEVGGDLLPINAVEQRGLWREEHKLEAIVCGQADVVLGADGVTLKERLVLRQIHLKIERHGQRRDIAGVGRLRQRDRERRGKAGSTRDDPDTRYGTILQCIAVLDSILLFEDLAAAQRRVGREQVEWRLARSEMLSADLLGLLHSSVSRPGWPSITPLPN